MLRTRPEHNMQKPSEDFKVAMPNIDYVLVTGKQKRIRSDLKKVVGNEKDILVADNDKQKKPSWGEGDPRHERPELKSGP